MKLSEETERVLPETPEEIEGLARLEVDFKEEFTIEAVCWRQLASVKKRVRLIWKKFAALYGKTLDDMGMYTFNGEHFYKGVVEHETETKFLGDNASLSLRGMKIKREALTEMITTLEEEMEKKEDDS